MWDLLQKNCEKKSLQNHYKAFNYVYLILKVCLTTEYESDQN